MQSEPELFAIKVIEKIVPVEFVNSGYEEEPVIVKKKVDVKNFIPKLEVIVVPIEKIYVVSPQEADREFEAVEELVQAVEVVKMGYMEAERIVEKLKLVDIKVVKTQQVEVTKEMPEFTCDPKIAKPENNPVQLIHQKIVRVDHPMMKAVQVKVKQEQIQFVEKNEEQIVQVYAAKEIPVVFDTNGKKIQNPKIKVVPSYKMAPLEKFKLHSNIKDVVIQKEVLREVQEVQIKEIEKIVKIPVYRPAE